MLRNMRENVRPVLFEKLEHLIDANKTQQLP
jgi:hypothetical protein